MAELHRCAPIQPPGTPLLLFYLAILPPARCAAPRRRENRDNVLDPRE